MTDPKLLCAIFGHRWRMLGWYNIEVNERPSSTITGWQCDRCGKDEVQQWDW